MEEIEMEEVVQLLSEYSWLFNFKVTDFFLDRVWESSPPKWLDTFKAWSYEDLAGVPFGKQQENWPETLKEFISQCLKYSVSREVDQSKTTFQCIQANRSEASSSLDCTPLQETDISPNIRKGMTQKKVHEVCRMAPLIHDVMGKSSAEFVVDVGSGLGYLGQVLHTKFKHKVLGLEGKQSHTSGAEKRVVQKDTNNCPVLQNRTCELYENTESESHFIKVLSDWLHCLPPDGSHGCSCKSGSRLSSSTKRKSDKNPGNHPSTVGEVKPVKSSLRCEETEIKSIYSENEIKETTQNIMRLSECDIHQNDSMQWDLTKSTDHNSKLKSSISKQKVNDHIQTAVQQSSTYECMSKPQTSLSASMASQANTNEGSQTSLPSVCMVGLHCCGDLTPTMLKYFAKMDFIKSLCVVSCCYHRMEFDEKQRTHKNFPYSSQLKRCLSSVRSRYPAFHFSPYSLRLAAQETRARWRQQKEEDHTFHTRNVAYRGILEMCLVNGQYVMEKTSRKIVHKADCRSFETYVTTVTKHIQVPDTVSTESHLKSFADQMLKLYDGYEPYFGYIEPITALQFLLQPVLESLVYQDRACWLREQGLNGSVVPIFDELISPRNLALIAIKR